MKQEKIAIVLEKNGMGVADIQLSTTLIKNYFGLIVQGELSPNYICFYAEGVKLVIEGSPILEELKILEEKGIKLIICKTCLVYYNIVEEVKVGAIGSMLDIINIQKNSTKVITL